MKPYTLNDATQNRDLTEDELNALVSLLGARCHNKTKNRLFYAIKYNQECFAIYDRVWIRPDVEYCAGQSYPDEIRTIRDLLLGR
jgi:hypothetical protein